MTKGNGNAKDPATMVAGQELEITNLKRALAEKETQQRSLRGSFTQVKWALFHALQENEKASKEKEAALKTEQEKTGELAAQLNASQAEAAHAKDNLLRVMRSCKTYEQSTSWKVTSPLRFAGRRFYNLKAFLTHIFTVIKLTGGISVTIWKIFRVLKDEGMHGLRHRFENVTGQKTNFIASSKKQHQNTNLFASAKKLEEDAQHVSNEPQLIDLQMGEIKRKALTKLKPLSVKVAEWIRPLPNSAISVEQLTQQIKKIVPKGVNRIILSITHDDYTKVVGGIQYCVQMEERNFSDSGALYLNLHPYQTLPVLSPERNIEGYFFNVIANGEFIGPVYAKTVITLLNDLKPHDKRNGIECVVHSLLGHSPEIIGNILLESPIKHASFWIHDYFSICPGYNLLRNEITYCDAPSPQSPACTICVFGEERKEHLGRLAELFNRMEFDIVSPSQSALDLWSRKTALPHGDSKVIPHCKLFIESNKGSAAPSSTDDIIRIAFLGHPVIHKGWLVFAQTADMMAEDQLYEFHHFGQTDTNQTNIQFTNVRTTATKPDEMAQAIMVNKIDVVLLWPIWPETFSFTLHEALAAGSLVLTNPVSGNIQAVVKNRKEGIVLDDENDLKRFFKDGSLKKLVEQHRSTGRKFYKTEFGSFSQGAWS